MGDEGDRSKEIEELALDIAFVNLEHQPKLRVDPDGSCHWCGEEFEAGSVKLFCNGACATAHADYNRKEIGIG